MFHVRKGVLRHIGHTKIGMDFEFAATAQIGGLGFSDNHFDQRRLSGTIRTQYGDTTAQRHFQIDIGELIGSRTGIGEIDRRHFQKFLRRSSNTLQPSRIGKFQFQLTFFVTQFKVVFGLWYFLHKGRHGTTVVYQLAIRTPNSSLFVVNNVGTNAFHKGSIVRHTNDGRVVQIFQQIAYQPLDGSRIQVIGGFVQQQNIGIHQHRRNQTQFHLPTTGQGTNGTIDHVISKFQYLKHGNAIGFGFRSHFHQIFQHIASFIDGIDVGTRIDIMGFEFHGPTIEFAIVDGVH
mmetsp:Transcript_3538/g.5465  ORF Transcript_3538/g.5465 Transcript_3538/m.5465 type:complete len:290 (-) Transcript_3538:392-1261(-)